MELDHVGVCWSDRGAMYVKNGSCSDENWLKIQVGIAYVDDGAVQYRGVMWGCIKKR